MGVKDTVNSEDLPLRLISKKGWDVPAQLLLELLGFPRDSCTGLLSVLRAFSDPSWVQLLVSPTHKARLLSYPHFTDGKVWL